MYNSGWANLKPQESKYTYALAVKAAKLLEAGETLSAVARELNVSRTKRLKTPSRFRLAIGVRGGSVGAWMILPSQAGLEKTLCPNPNIRRF